MELLETKIKKLKSQGFTLEFYKGINNDKYVVEFAGELEVYSKDQLEGFVNELTAQYESDEIRAIKQKKILKEALIESLNIVGSKFKVKNFVVSVDNND